MRARPVIFFANFIPLAAWLSRADKANAAGLCVTDKNVRAIDNNYYTLAKETEARVRPRRAG